MQPVSVNGGLRNIADSWDVCLHCRITVSGIVGQFREAGPKKGSGFILQWTNTDDIYNKNRKNVVIEIDSTFLRDELALQLTIGFQRFDSIWLARKITHIHELCNFLPYDNILFFINEHFLAFIDVPSSYLIFSLDVRNSCRKLKNPFLL